VIELDAAGLRRDDYIRIVRGGERVSIAESVLEAVAETRATMLAHIDTGVVAYGVTTGLGRLAGVTVTEAEQQELQHSLLTARAAAFGPALPAEVVRGAMLIRLAGFLQGVAGVTPELCRFIAARLDDGWSPVVPAGPYGAAGEIGPLAHLFQTLLGEGTVLLEGSVVTASDALVQSGIEPYCPRSKEGLALVNGSPLATALGIRLGDRARLLVSSATSAAALSIAVSCAGARASSPRVGAVARDRFAEIVQHELTGLLEGEDVWTERTQPPVSARVVPQVHGAALRSLAALDLNLDSRLAGTTDSPIFLGVEDRGTEGAGLYPSGAFHAVDVVLGLETLANACCHVVNLLEKRLHRLLDARFSGLPDQLTDQPGVQAGVVALHKSTVGLVAEARTLAAPASIHAIDTSGGQEDVQSFTLLAASRLDQLLDLLEAALACELVALRQAAHLARTRPAGEPLRRLVDVLANDVPPVDRDRTLTPDVMRVRSLVASGTFLA